MGTHIMRTVDKVGSKLHKKEVVEACTIVETPPMTVIGVVGYIETVHGMRTLTTVFAQHLSDEVKRRFYKNYSRTRCKKKAYVMEIQVNGGDIAAKVDFARGLLEKD